VGCGQCLPCRINRRRLWMWRQYLESLCHETNCFVTLTYNDECLPKGGDLCHRDVQLFLKSFRRKIAPVRVRYFMCGEYGPDTLRPHYHLSLFGVGVECSALVNDLWAKGFTYTTEFTQQTAQYIAGYVVKKLVDRNDPRMSGKVPEYARMSNRPGIGGLATTIIVQQLNSIHGTTLF